MVVRKFVTAVAVATALVLGTTGCSLSHNVATMQQYAPSDGAQITVDGVKGLNLIYLTQNVTDLGGLEVGAIIGSFVNTTDQPVQIRLQYQIDGSQSVDVIAAQTFDWVSEIIMPGQKYDLGYNESPAIYGVALNAKNLVAKPGDLISVFVGVNDAQGVQVLVPALDGALEQYKTLVDNLAAIDENSAE
ncbi:MAG: hypothetical protein F2529_05065 [Actinobacteria bacterium]|uniref:Unannotated protein n=1 Tax=freshwater metagenome TaxID=449393 RepID=A0A6J6CAW4_9ZZZZ|nr:hypothetical protein [Actinomycetota bacterium]